MSLSREIADHDVEAASLSVFKLDSEDSDWARYGEEYKKLTTGT